LIIAAAAEEHVRSVTAENLLIASATLDPVVLGSGTHIDHAETRGIDTVIVATGHVTLILV
jgi:hypothetical protein